MKKKVIIGLVSLTIIGSTTYLIYAFETKKDNQEKVESETSPKEQKENNPEVENPEKKEEKVKRPENDEQPLTSYFSVFIVFWIIMIIIFLLTAPGYVSSINAKKSEPYYYLMFIKMVCEIVCYENCMVHNTKDKKLESDKYKPVLQLNMNELQIFLNIFLFQSQSGKNKVRQQAHRIVFYLQHYFSVPSLALFLFFILSYLLTIIINLIVNICFHGFTKTRSRLKISYLWAFIHRMDKLAKKNVAYALLSFPLLFFGFYCFMYFFYYKEPPYDHDSIKHYWILTGFYHKFKTNINSLFQTEEKYKNKSQKFCEPIELSDDDGPIINHNLNSVATKDFNETEEELQEHKESFLQGGKILFEEMKKYFDQSNEFEKDILQRLQNFMNNNEINE